MSATFCSQPREPRATAKIPYPMIARTSTATAPPTAIGPQLRPPLALTGVIGLRPLAPPPFGPVALAPVAFAAEAFGFDPAGGLPWPEVLPTLTVDGTRSGPGVLILIAPRQFICMGKGGARVAAERRSLPP